MKIHINSEDRASNEIPERFSINLGSIGNHRSDHQIAVTSVQIPLSFYQLRKGYNNEFRMTFSDLSTKSIFLGNIPQVNGYNGNDKYDGNPSATVMGANIVSQLNVNTSGQIFSYSVNTNTGRFTIKTSVSSTFSITKIDPYVFSVMGFDDAASSYSTSNGILESPRGVNMTPFDCLYIKSSIDSSNDGDYDSRTKGQTNIIAKVPCTIQNITMFSNLLYEPTVPIYKRIAHLNGSYKFELIYQTGETVNLNGGEWSFTLDYHL